MKGRYALKYFSQNIRDNEKIVLAAIIQSEESLEFASERLRSDKRFLRNAIECNIRVLKYVGKDIRAHYIVPEQYRINRLSFELGGVKLQ